MTATAEATFKACCASFWEHPGLRLLLGESFHPGGAVLTARALDVMALPSGARIVDVGSGAGASAALARERGLEPIALEYSAYLAAEARDRVALVVNGDAEHLPIAEGSAAGALVECVLSAIPDKSAALREIRRVVGPRGRIGISDVTVAGAMPPPLDSVVGWMACVAGGLAAADYASMVNDAGFGDVRIEDHSSALEAMIRQARRRLALAQAAAATGVAELAGFPPPVLDVVQGLLAMTLAQVAAGTLGYALITAEAR